jgi:hypothetical protein
VQKVFATLLLFVLSGIGFGQESVTMPAGKLATITIGDALGWVVVPPVNGELIREHNDDVKVIKLRLLGYTNGTYYVVASYAKDKMKTWVVVIGDLPPQPTDLLKSLQSAYDADKDKGTHLEELIELYDQGAAFAKGRTDITTYTQLGTVFSQVAKKLGCNGKLVEMQKLIAAEMTGFTTGTFDREKLVAQLQRISVLLRQVK